jgi:hypothetical protein
LGAKLFFDQIMVSVSSLKALVQLKGHWTILKRLHYGVAVTSAEPANRPCSSAEATR